MAPPALTNGAPGTNGIDGTNGTNGTNGIDGTSVTFVDYFSGNQNGCPNGGAVYAAGNPPVSAYVCNGAEMAPTAKTAKTGRWGRRARTRRAS